MTSPAPEVTPGLAAVRSWCGWHIAPSATETVKVESEGGRVILLPSLHVTDVTAVRDESGSVIATYKWRENGIVRGYWRAEELYAFDITHGYDEMPPEIQAIIDQIDADGVGSRAVTAESAGAFSRSFGTADLESQPLSVRAVIARYKLNPGA
jgi:hypothetical protein